MLIEVTVDVRDLDPDGPIPAGARVTFARLSSTEQDGVLVSTRPVSVPLADGHGTAELQAETVYLVGCYSMPGFPEHFAVRTGSAHTTLGALWRDGQVDRGDFQPRPVPLTVAEALEQLRQEAAALYATKDDLAAASGAGHQYAQATPSAQWSIPHPLGRRPTVSLYDATGALILADVAASASLVVVTFANPTAGSAVLT